MTKFACITLALALCACLLGSAAGANVLTECLNAEVGSLMGQDNICEIDSPYCNWTEQKTRKRCGTCRVGQSMPAYGGSCDCDARTSFCDQQSGLVGGQCTQYTLLDTLCTTDDNCKTTTTRTSIAGTSITVTNERLFCVKGKCKPCQPDVWLSQKGELGVASIVCPGYDATLSNNLARYATESRLPAVEYTCDADGNIVYLQPTVDYNYEFSCGDRSQWPGDCGVSATPSSAPGQSGSPQASAMPDSGAGAMIVGWMAVGVAAVLLLAL